MKVDSDSGRPSSDPNVRLSSSSSGSSLSDLFSSFMECICPCVAKRKLSHRISTLPSLQDWSSPVGRESHSSLESLVDSDSNISQLFQRGMQIRRGQLPPPPH